MSIDTTFKIFLFFKMAAVRHLRFLKVRNFNCWSGSEFQYACVIMPNALPIVQTVADTWQFLDFFKIVATTILEFPNFKFLTVGTVKRVELRHRAKFCRNCSNRGRDVAIFRFFLDGGRPPSWICDACGGTTHEGHLVVFITVQNLVRINAIVLIICTFFDFTILAWKRPFRPKNCFFLWIFWPPKWGVMELIAKRHILARVHVVWAIMRENPSTGLTCRWVPKKGS